MSKTKIYILLVLIIALGAFLRIYNIDNAPPGVYPDEAVNGIDAARAAETGNFEWFYPDNNGREGLYINVIAIFFKFFGISVLTLKLASIFFGTITIWGVYLLGKELFRNERVGLIAAYLTAVSFWAINFSRIGFRAIALPAILSFSFYFLLLGLRSKKWFHFALGGFIFGLGLHTYIAFRIAPAILFAVLLILIINRRHFLKSYWTSIAVFVIFTTISAAPMLYTFFVSHPEYFESRSASVSVFSPEVNGGNPIKAFAKSFSLSMLKYNFWGDQNWRHNFPPYPLLDPITGIAFLIGLIYSIFKFFHLAAIRIFKKARDYKTGPYLLLISSFFLMLAPEFLTAEGNPHALRAIGTLPFVFIFSAMAFNYFLGKTEEKTYLQKKVAGFLILIMLLSIGVFNTVKYHVVWANKEQTADSFEKNLMDITYYLKTLPSSTEKIIIAENMQRIPIKLFSKNISNIEYFYHSETADISPKNKNDFIIIITDRDDGAISAFQRKFPGLKLEEMNDGKGTSFYVLK